MSWRLAGLYLRPDRTCAVRSQRFRLFTVCGTEVPRGRREVGGLYHRGGTIDSVDCADCKHAREWWEREA